MILCSSYGTCYMMLVGLPVSVTDFKFTHHDTICSGYDSFVTDKAGIKATGTLLYHSILRLCIVALQLDPETEFKLL